MLETMRTENFGEFDIRQLVAILSTIGTEDFGETNPPTSVTTELEKTLAVSLSAASLLQTETGQSENIESFMDPDQLIETTAAHIAVLIKVLVTDSAVLSTVDSESLSIMASKLNWGALEDIGEEGVSRLVAHIGYDDIMNLEPTVVRGLIEFLDADYLGDNILHFDEAKPMVTFITTNYVAPPDAFLELMESEGVAGIFKGLFR